MANARDRDLYPFTTMSDDEIRGVVQEQLRETPELDAEWIDINVQDGFVTLSGRVGTDREVQIAEELLDDVLGLEEFSNELIVDELHRGERPMAADDAATSDREVEDQMGGRDVQQSDTAAHLVEDLEHETYGTHDMGEAIENGMPYVPPDRPVGDGYGNRENH